MSKTIKEWLSELPEPYKGKALAHAKLADTLDDSGYNSVQIALFCAFDWTDTPEDEGYHYWKKIHANPLPRITSALQAIHAIALKKGFPAEEILSVWMLGNNQWNYELKDSGE